MSAGRTDACAGKVPWWKRVLRALRVSVRPGKSWRKLVSYVGIEGRIKF